MIYFYIDGDDVGLRLERSLLNNDEIALIRINAEVTSIIDKLTERLVDLGCEVVFSGADGVIGKCKSGDSEAIQRCVCTLNASLTFSIGIGWSLRDAFAALRFAKASGKNGLATLDKGFTWKSNPELVERDEKSLCGTPEFENLSGDSLSHNSAQPK